MLRATGRVALWAVSRRLEIELTSQRGDGSWTWRAAGARQPKGEVRADLVPDSAAVGTVLKVEADGGLDGLEIVTVFAPRSRPERGDRLELIGGGGGPLVTTKLVSGRRSKSSRPDGADDDRPSGRDRRRDRRDRRDRRGDDRRDRKRARDGERREDGDRGRRDRKPRRGDDRGDRSRGGPSDSRKDRRPERSPRRDGGGDRHARRSKDAPRAPRPRTPALKAKRVHRQAALSALPEDQRPLAREVLKGGVPGVRKSIERMNAKAKAESLPLIKTDPVLALAEQLAPLLKAAEWHDRADAALAGISKIDLRDIRSVIAAADRAARTDETRALAESLREGLVQRLEVDHRKWLDELAGTIGEGRTIRALRLSSRPPKAGAPLPPDMAERLAAIAAADLNPTANQQRWSTVVDAVALSPVRTQVVPAGVPDSPTDELLTAIRRLSDRVPQIAALFGIEPKPPSRGPKRPPPPPPTPDTAAAKPEQEDTPPAEAAKPEQDGTPPTQAEQSEADDTAAAESAQPEQDDAPAAEADTAEQDDAPTAEAAPPEQDDAPSTETAEPEQDEAPSTEADTARQEDSA